MPSAAVDPVLRVKEAAEWLGVHPNTLRWWRRHGRGPLYERRGSHHVYRQSALEAYQADGAAEAAQELAAARKGAA